MFSKDLSETDKLEILMSWVCIVLKDHRYRLCKSKQNIAELQIENKKLKREIKEIKQETSKLKTEVKDFHKSLQEFY